MGARFSIPVQTGPGAHQASCTMGTRSFPGVKSDWGVMLTPHPLLVSWSRKGRAIPLLPVWAVQSLSACTRGALYLYLYPNARLSHIWNGIHITTASTQTTILCPCLTKKLPGYIAHLRQECHNSKSVIFQERLLKVLKCYNFQWVQWRHNFSPVASFTNCVMTLYLLKVHLQTFLSIPITQKCQILSWWHSCCNWAICLSVTVIQRFSFTFTLHSVFFNHVV